MLTCKVLFLNIKEGMIKQEEEEIMGEKDTV
jgi:hypothetical protein